MGSLLDRRAAKTHNSKMSGLLTKLLRYLFFLFFAFFFLAFFLVAFFFFFAFFFAIIFSFQLIKSFWIQVNITILIYY